MNIAAIGLNYRTAPVEMREKLTLSGCALHFALEDMGKLVKVQTEDGQAVGIDEAVILSTCNRLEIYISTAHADGAALVKQFLSRLQNIPLVELEAHLYDYAGEDAVRHLMQVACGLDSMILGEAQILGQVSRAFEDAHAAGITGPVLSHLFAQAIHTGKRAHTESPISRYTTSVSHVGAQLMLEKLGQRTASRVLLIGAGEMIVLAAQALQRFDVHDLAFINRTYSRAEALAGDFSGQALAWQQLDEALVWADAVICATGAPHAVIFRRDVEAVLPRRGERPLVLVDIAVPRDIEDTVREIPAVQYFDIDDLQSVVDGNIGLREAAIPQVKTIIQQEMTRFAEWYYSRQVTPVIKTLREWAQSVADDELGHALNRLSGADERTRQVVSLMAHRLVNRLMHEPTSRLRIQATEGNGCGYVHAVRELFALDTPDDQPDVMCRSANGECNLECILPYSTGQQI